MIEIISVNPTGYFSYARHGTIELSNRGLVLLEGVNKDRSMDSNGSGKTSLFNAMTHILFGKNPTGHSGESIINRALDKCFGIVKFRTDDGLYRIIEVRKWRRTDNPPDMSVLQASAWINSGESYSGTDVYFERFDDGTATWIDERATTIVTGNTRLDMKATRKKILDILGVSYDQFMSVAYLAQQETVKFLNGGHKERMEVFGEIADVSAWDARISRVREDINKENAGALALDGKLSGLRHMHMTYKTAMGNDDIFTLGIDLSALEIKISSTSTEIDLKNDKLSKLIVAKESTQEELNRISKQVHGATARLQTLSQGSAKIAVDQTNEMRNAIGEARPALELDSLENSMAFLKNRAAYSRQELNLMMQTPGRCGHCKSPVSAEHLLRQKELLNKSIKEDDDMVESFKVEYNMINDKWLAEAAQKEEDLKNKYAALLEANSVEYNTTIAEVDALSDTRTAVQLQIRDMTLLEQTLRGEVATLTSSMYSLLSSKEKIVSRISAYNTRNEDIKKLATEIEMVEKAVAASASRSRHLMAVERLFGDKGMKAQCLDSAIDAINFLLRSAIADISDNQISVWVTKTRDKSNGEKTTDIQVIVKDGSKQDVAYELYSGGEKQQITLAFVTAFWLLASQYGTGVNILCLDEVFGPLDTANSASMFAFIEKMRSLGKNSIFIVTHNQAIKKTVNFDEIWTASKESDCTTLTTVEQ